MAGQIYRAYVEPLAHIPQIPSGVDFLIRRSPMYPKEEWPWLGTTTHEQTGYITYDYFR